MPILANAKKALRVSQRKAVINRRIRSRNKSAVDTFKANPSAKLLSEAYTAIDKSVKRNLFHRNRGARMKSSLSAIAKAAGIKFEKKSAVAVKAKTKSPKGKAAPKTASKKKAVAKKAAPKKATKKTSKKK